MGATELPVYSVNGHKEIINCIDGVGGLGIGEGAPEIVTGSRDGTYVWKSQKSFWWYLKVIAIPSDKGYLTNIYNSSSYIPAEYLTYERATERNENCCEER